jgi:hypothetical protein
MYPRRRVWHGQCWDCDSAAGLQTPLLSVVQLAPEMAQSPWPIS